MTQAGFDLLLGFMDESGNQGMGIHQALNSKQEKWVPITDSSEGHLLTVAPTGAGKGRSCVIPTLLEYPGSVICIDPKGENFHVTHQQRRRMGQRIVRLDPFQIYPEPTDRFNVFDLLQLPGATPDADVEMLVELIVGEPTTHHDRFWDLASGGMLTGICGYLSESNDPEKNNIGELHAMANNDDVDYNLAKILDEYKFKSQLFYREIASYLSNESDKCRPSIRSTAQARIRSLGSEPIRNVLGDSTFPIEELLYGDPITIYLMLPVEKLYSHRAVTRLWVGSLMSILMRRENMPTLPTLCLLDEVAQLGQLGQLRQALTLMRGFGMRCWTFWQDLSQLRQNLPNDWQSIVNNSGVLQFFGMNNRFMAAECATLLGVPADDLYSLKPDQQMIHIAGKGTMITRKLDYLKDSRYAGLFDVNPRYQRRDVR